LLVDDLSRYMWVVVLGSKGEAANAIRRAQAAAEAECGHKLRMLHTNNDGEFTTAEFASYYVDEGVQCHYSTPYSPQENDVVERRNQTVVRMAWALLKQRGIPVVLWGEAVVTVVYILNRSPTKALNVGRRRRLGMGANRWSLTYGSSAALRSPRSLVTSASSTTGDSGGVHRLRGGLEGLPYS
jgi:transposase InsO family protein